MKQRNRRRRSAQSGFTIIELMIVVVMIGILAKVAIPAFFKETRKTKSTTEVAAMFAELQTREEQFKVESGAYRSSALCPAAPSAQGVDTTTCAASADWVALRVKSPEKKVFCTYQVFSGSGTGTNNPSGFSFTSPARGWYYIIATCDMDGSSTTNATYFTSSMESSIQKFNEGK